MSNLTIISLGIAALMLAFFFVDASGGNRNKTVMTVQFVILVVAVVVALISYLIGGM